MKILNFKNFMKEFNLKNDIMNDLELQRVYNYSIYPRGSKLKSYNAFIKIDDGSQGGSH